MQEIGDSEDDGSSDDVLLVEPPPPKEGASKKHPTSEGKASKKKKRRRESKDSSDSESEDEAKKSSGKTSSEKKKKKERPVEELMCPECGKGPFSSYSARNEHIKKVHKEDKVPCAHCKLLLVNHKSNINRHEKYYCPKFPGGEKFKK